MLHEPASSLPSPAGRRGMSADGARRPGPADRRTTRLLCHARSRAHLHTRRDVRWHRAAFARATAAPAPRVAPRGQTRVSGRLPPRSPHAGRPMMTRHSRESACGDRPGTLLIARRPADCHCRRIHDDDARQRQPRLRDRRPDPRHRLGFAVVRRNARVSWRDPLVPQPGRDAEQTSPRQHSKRSIEASFNAWESVDDGVPEEPLVPVVNFGGQTTVADAVRARRRERRRAGSPSFPAARWP